MMQLQDDAAGTIKTHFELIVERLPLEDGQRLVELGCGRAETTLQLAERFPNLKIIATEVDPTQHAKNLAVEDFANVNFKFGGAEKIPVTDASVNFVVMLKSLHHVPLESMKPSLDEIRRVLVPGGLAYIAEPVYAGPFNDILKLFNDEQMVRQAAFETVKEAVESGSFELVEQIFFLAAMRFSGFAEFQQKIIGATHSTYSIDDRLQQQIKSEFVQAASPDGAVEFLTPQRVDLIKRPENQQEN